ncbi:MAG: M56 family metallopeptidase [Thermoanaerobaculia bacterium]|nr:M56 family metallopeptidase [Thermoanaerobaculia bacterium]
MMLALWAKSALVVALTLGAASLLATGKADQRHKLWTLCFCLLAFLPLLHRYGPALEIPGPLAAPLLPTVPAAPDVASHAGSKLDGMRSMPLAAEAPPELAPGARSVLRSSPSVWLVGGWLAGTGGFLIWFTFQVASLQRLRRSAEVLLDGPWRRELSTCVDALGLEKAPRLLISPKVVIPMLTGWSAPCLFVPESARSWSPRRRRAVLLHELAHLRRGDLTSNWLGELCRALYWPNPLVWIALHLQREEAELAADAQVVAAGTDPLSYASDLLEMVRNVRRDRGFALAALALPLSRRRGLSRRIRALTNRTASYSPPAAWIVGLIAVAGLTVALGRPTPSPPPAESESPDLPLLLAVLDDESKHARLQAAWELGERESPGATPALVASLADPDPEVRMLSAWALGEIKDQEALEPLLEAIDDSDLLVQEMVVRAIGELESAASVPALEQLAGSPTTPLSIRHAAIWALGEVANDHAFAILERTLRDPVDSVRRATAQALTPSRFPSAVVVLSSALDDPEPEVRVAAAHQLGASESRLARLALIDALGDPSAAVRRRASEGLGHHRHTEAVMPLIQRLRDPDEGVRAAATWALDEIGT